jgi:hypothetical protein
MHTSVCGLDCVLVLGDCLGATSIGDGVGTGNGCWTDGLQVISETLPRMLFLVVHKDVFYVTLRICFAVGLGTTIMGGASVTCWRGNNLAG